LAKAFENGENLHENKMREVTVLDFTLQVPFCEVIVLQNISMEQTVGIVCVVIYLLSHAMTTQYVYDSLPSNIRQFNDRHYRNKCLL